MAKKPSKLSKLSAIKKADDEGNPAVLAAARRGNTRVEGDPRKGRLDKGRRKGGRC
jgi:hypothetical protein